MPLKIVEPLAAAAVMLTAPTLVEPPARSNPPPPMVRGATPAAPGVPTPDKVRMPALTEVVPV